MNYYRIFFNIYQRAAQKMCLECQEFIEKGSRILDLGCGSGIAGKAFQEFFQADLIEVDIKDKRVVNIPFQIIDGINLPFPENYFDVVLINYVLHHAKNPLALLKEAKRVTKDKIIIYEDLPERFLGKAICWFHGYTFHLFFQHSKTEKREKLNFNFKTNKEWRDVFENLELKSIFEKRISSIFNPIEKKLFVLEKI